MPFVLLVLRYEFVKTNSLIFAFLIVFASLVVENYATLAKSDFCIQMPYVKTSFNVCIRRRTKSAK